MGSILVAHRPGDALRQRVRSDDFGVSLADDLRPLPLAFPLHRVRVVLQSDAQEGDEPLDETYARRPTRRDGCGASEGP